MIVIFTIDDIDCLEDMSAEAVKMLAAKGLRPQLVPDYKILESTGIARWVADEVRLVLLSDRGGGPRTYDFLQRWGMSQFVDYQIDELSGGWRRYLHLALHLERINSTECPVVVGASQHLAPELVAKLSLRVQDTFESAAFLEYDATQVEASIESIVRVPLDVRPAALRNQNSGKSGK